MIPLDEILESLDLSRAQPGIGFLEALFSRFNARVPFESASKIVRNAEVADRDARPRTPEIFWADHIESGAGGTCFARVAAFDALLSGIGFRTRRVLGRVERNEDHAALIVETPAGESIADVGFPLPALLPARPGRHDTALGGLCVEPIDRGFSISWTEGVPEGPRSLEIFLAPVSEERFREIWRDTFQSSSKFLKHVVLRRDLGNRAVSYAGGHVRVDDLHSRLKVPITPPRDAALAEIFGVDREILSRAFRLVGEDAGESAGSSRSSLTAYLETAASPDDAFAAIASPGGYRRLIDGVARVVSEEPTPLGFRLAFTAPGGAESDGAGAARTVDDATPDLAARRLRLVRSGGTSAAHSSYAAERRGGKTYLLREATFGEAREDLLRNDSLRGRFAGMLALDLLAWSRLL